MSKEIIFNPELSERLKSGSDAVCHTVQCNFGPLGKNTIRDQKTDLPVIANSGRKILPEFSLSDRVKNLSAVLLREAALNVAAECGDGSIAVTVLADALLSEGEKLMAAGYNPMFLRKGVEQSIALVRDYLSEITVPLSVVGIERLAAAVSKNDEVAANVAKAFSLVGTDGIITIQDSQLRETVLNYWDGARYDYGLYNNAFINDPENRRAVLSEPYVFLANTKIKTLQDIRKLLENVIQSDASLLIIASDVADEVMQILTANVARGLKVVAAKAPGHGDSRRRNMLALAAKIGSLMFEDNTGRRMGDCGLEVCSRISRAEVNKDQTVLQGFRDSSEEMTEILRRHTLQCLEAETRDYEIEKLQTTLAILNGKTAEILAGAPIEYEMFEKKYLYENTVSSIRNAARSGLVPGAGNTYLYLEQKLRAESASWPEAEAAGTRCLCEGLMSLSRRLAENAGEDGGVVINEIKKADNPFTGYDVLSGKLVNLLEAGILTPADTLEKIVKTAAETAASLWTASAAVIEQ